MIQIIKTKIKTSTFTGSVRFWMFYAIIFNIVLILPNFETKVLSDIKNIISISFIGGLLFNFPSASEGFIWIRKNKLLYLFIFLPVIITSYLDFPYSNSLRLLIFIFIFYKFIQAIYSQYLQTFLPIHFKAIVSNILNLFIVFIAFIFLVNMSHGIDIIINLIEGNYLFLALFFWLLSVMARSMYHNSFVIYQLLFPSQGIKYKYVEIFKSFKVSQQVRSKDYKNYDNDEHVQVKLFRLFLASTIYLFWIYALINCYTTSFGHSKFLESSFILSISMTLLYTYFILSARKWVVTNPNLGYKKTYNQMFFTLIKIYPILLNLLFVSTIVFSIVLLWNGWSKVTLISIILFSLINMIVFITRRVFRKEINFYLGTSSSEEKTQIIGDLSSLQKKDYKNLTFLPIRLLNKLNSIGSYKKIQFVITIENIVIIVGVFLLALIQLLSDYLFYGFGLTWIQEIKTACIFNPLIILFAIIIAIYTHLIHITKRFLAWKNNPKQFPSFSLLIVLLIPIGIVYSTFNTRETLHKVPTYERKNSSFRSGENFIKKLNTQFNLEGQQEKPNLFIICAAGGGMRSNIWTQLILKELKEKTTNKLDNNTLLISGVSGGGIGLGNYVLQNFYKDDSINLEKIATENILSPQLLYLFINEAVVDLLPPFIEYNQDNLGPDRSVKALIQTSTTISNNDPELYKMTFIDLWDSVYSTSSHFPAIVTTSTSTSNRVGFAHPLHGVQESRTFENILEGSNNQTASFLGALSTTNRFPFIDPPAFVENKGHFLDGGYFDNTGIVGAQYLLSYVLNKDSILNNYNLNFILINNSKSSFYNTLDLPEEQIQNVYSKIHPNEINLISILKTLINANYKASSFNSEFLISNKNYRIHDIALPYKIDINKEEVINIQNDSTRVLINHYNSNIDSILSINTNYKKRWGYTPPGLSRMLSKPSYEYMNSMIKHPDVQLKLDSVSLLINANQVINNILTK